MHISLFKLVKKCDYLLGMDISAIALIVAIIESKLKVWQYINRENYFMVLILSEILLSV